MRQAENKVKIEGILAETDLNYGSFERNGKKIESVGGSIKILVDQIIDGKPVTLEIPVYMFSTKYTKKGTVNPAYESIEKVMTEYKSIGNCGNKEQADKVRITNAQIKMNEFYGQNGNLVSYPRINASFVSRATGEFKPEASFSLEFLVSNMARVMDKDGVEIDPAKLEINIVVPQYTPDGADAPNIDIVKLHATNSNVINAIEQYWEAGYSYKATGRLNFSSTTETVVEELGFGEPKETVRTINVSEFIVTGGSEAPLDGDYSFDIDEIKAGIAARKVRLENLKSSKSSAKSTPAQKGKNAVDLGF